MATTKRRAEATRRTKSPHPAEAVAFTDLDEAFFRAGDLMSETGELSGDRTVDEMYARVPLRHRILRALDVRTWFRRPARPVARAVRRDAGARQLSQPLEICAGG